MIWKEESDSNFIVTPTANRCHEKTAYLKRDLKNHSPQAKGIENAHSDVRLVMFMGSFYLKRAFRAILVGPANGAPIQHID